jgi:hypothetical protein
MKKMRNLEWGEYRHPEFLQSLTMSVNEFKFVRMFLKRGSVAMVNELLRERKTKQDGRPKDYFPPRFQKREKIEA